MLLISTDIKIMFFLVFVIVILSLQIRHLLILNLQKLLYIENHIGSLINIKFMMLKNIKPEKKHYKDHGKKIIFFCFNKFKWSLFIKA